MQNEVFEMEESECLLQYKMTNILLTVCSIGKSIFSGLVRLAPKIMKPESIPAEWRALSKLKQKHTRVNQCYTITFPDI